MVKTVGDYKLCKTLGEGSFSKVKQAVHIPTGKVYAIKIIDMNLVKENKMDKQLEREIKVMKIMNHPNLIKLHAVLHSPKNYFLVLDLAEGGELFNKLAQDGPLPEAAARSYFQQLIDALDYMHKHNTIHRDLKPENLLLDSEGNLKIADFGLSIMANSSTDLLKTRCGTPNYVAPEIFCSNGYVGPPADLWSAGVILYVMLAAALPFDAPTLPELARQIMKVQIIYPDSFPRGAVELMKHIIVADPNDRYTIEQIRQDPWFKVNYKPRVAGKDKESFPDAEVTVSQKDEESSQEDETINAFELIAKMSGVDMGKLIDHNIPVNASTSISTSKTQQEIQTILTKALNKLHAEIHSKEGSKSIKAVVPVTNNQVTLRIDISNVTGDTRIVEFCRLKGQQFDFLRVYRTLKTKLTS